MSREYVCGCEENQEETDRNASRRSPEPLKQNPDNKRAYCTWMFLSFARAVHWMEIPQG